MLKMCTNYPRICNSIVSLCINDFNAILALFLLSKHQCSFVNYSMVNFFLLIFYFIVLFKIPLKERKYV